MIVLFTDGPLLADARQDVQQGLNDYALADYQHAVEGFSRALAASSLPRDAAATTLANRGAALMKLERYQDAVDDYTNALELKPGFVSALTGRAAAYLNLGELDLAIVDNSAVILVSPDNKMALNNRGTAYLLSGYVFEAIEDYDRVIALEARGDYTGNISDFGISKSAGPNTGIAYFNRANAYMRWGQIRIATLALDEFIWQRPDSPYGWFLRCRCNAEVDRIENALDDCARALGLSPQNARMFEFMGTVLERAGKPDKAIERYRQALQVDPALSDARAGLMRLNADL